MLDSHFTERRLADWGNGSFVHWSKKPQGKAVIFIHGFNGGPEDTFSEFEILFRELQCLGGYDIYFYGYDSLFQPAESSAKEFKDFLHYIQAHSAVLYNSSMREVVASRPVYGKIVIVAHSLGAVVSRLALLSAYKSGHSWANNCSLLLFAPAHKGTSLSLTALISGEALPGLYKLISLVSGFFVPTMKELQGKSDVLTDLERETVNLIDNYNVRTFTIAKAVVWASRERIVRNKSFGYDPESVLIPRTNHSSVCKPHRKFLRPLEIFEQNL